MLTDAEKDALLTEAVADVRPTVLPKHRVVRHEHQAGEYSRWRGGPTSLPPAGKIAVTVAVLLLSAWLVRYSLGSGIIVFVYALYVIRETWKRARIK